VLGGIGSGGPGTGVGLVGAGPGGGSVGTGKGGCSGGTGTSGGMLGDVSGFALVLVLVLEWREGIGDGRLVSNAIMGGSMDQREATRISSTSTINGAHPKPSMLNRP
jgi:hypothetical protein